MMFRTGPVARTPRWSPTKTPTRLAREAKGLTQTEFDSQGQHSPSACQQRGGARLETFTDTLMKRVNKLIRPSKPSRRWGNPLLSTTPSSIAIRELALRTEALEEAVREIALEVQKLSDKS